MTRRYLWIALALPAPAVAEEGDTIVVTGADTAGDVEAIETRHRLAGRPLDVLGAGSADQILRRLPSVNIPTNSRGESIAFLRSAGERQVAIFYEGAAINVPWDNRLDLSLFPAGLIGSVRSAAGPLAPHYGVNALGALSLSPRRTSHLLAQAGSGDLAEGEAVLATELFQIGGSYSRRDGETLSDDARLPFSQAPDRLRTNTDRELASVFGRIGGTVGAHTLGLTAFHVWGDKGIAPESNRATGARLWRYPDIRHTLVVANATSVLGPDTTLTSAAWYQRFGQTIDNYTSATYERVSAQQVDRDETWGVRELIEQRLGAATLIGSVNLLDSTHRQRDATYVSGNPPATLPAFLTYRQRNWSVGAELQYQLSEALRADVAIGVDEVDYLRTGDKPPVRDASQWTGRAGVSYAAGGGWTLRAAAGRKMRAPTLRERFGEAIARFLINPDLRPEKITTVEAGAEWRGEQASFFVIPFLQDLDDTIDQRNVGRLRQRINLSGSTVRGVELGGAATIAEGLGVSGDATWTRVRRKDAAAGVINRIAEKPSLLARVRADYLHASGVSGRVEAEHVGRAFSADPDGLLVPLPRSTALNLRLAYGMTIGGKRWELFGQADNVTDTFVVPQLGLPAPGRTLRIGLRLD